MHANAHSSYNRTDDAQTNWAALLFGANVARADTNATVSRAEIPSMHAQTAKFDEYFPALRAGFGLGKAPYSTSDTLYRGDARPFDTIFNEGFTARGANTDLVQHAIGRSTATDSAYIATSTEREIAARFPTSEAARLGLYPQTFSGQTYVYDICTAKTPIDVAEQLADSREINYDYSILKLFGSEQEKVFIQKIASHEIKGAWEVDIKQLFFDPNSSQHVRELSDTFIHNPNYRAPYYYEKLFWNGTRALGYLGFVVGGVVDGTSLYREYQQSVASGNFDNTKREASRIGGGWTSAMTLGSSAAMAGAEFCALVAPPIGPAACAFAMGTAGSVLGYMGGGLAGTVLFDESHKTSRYDVSNSSAAFFASRSEHAEISDSFRFDNSTQPRQV